MTNLVASIKKRWNRLTNRNSSGLALANPVATRAYTPDSSESEPQLDRRTAPLTMLFPAESDALRDYTYSHYKGLGEVIDLGAWAGSSTLALAQGLQANSNVDKSRKRIHAYDIFIWEQWMSDIPWNTPLVDGYKPGDSFLPLYQAQIAEYQDLIETYPGDMNQMAEFDKPIEYLFVDVMKNWELANSSLSKFFTKLIPGKSVVHHQDYNHYFTTWIHLIMYRFREHFQLRQYVDGTPSTIFDYVSEIPRESLLQKYDFDSFTNDEFEAAYEYSLSITGKAAWPSIACARIMAFIHQLDWDRAETEFSKIRSKYSQKNYDMQQIEKILKTRIFR